MILGSFVIAIALMVPPVAPMIIIAGTVIAVRSGALA